MTRLRNVICSRHISRGTRKRLIRSLVFSAFIYVAETWTMRAEDKRRIDAIEMWVWRRMLRIPCTARQTNVSIVNELDESIRLSVLGDGRKLGYFSHIMRKKDGNLEKDILFDKAPTRKGREDLPSGGQTP